MQIVASMWQIQVLLIGIAWKISGMFLTCSWVNSWTWNTYIMEAQLYRTSYKSIKTRRWQENLFLLDIPDTCDEQGLGKIYFLVVQVLVPMAILPQMKQIHFQQSRRNEWPWSRDWEIGFRLSSSYLEHDTIIDLNYKAQKTQSTTDGHMSWLLFGCSGFLPESLFHYPVGFP